MQRKSEKPLLYTALEKRSIIPAKGKLKSSTVTLLDISLKGTKNTRLIKQQGRLRVEAKLDANGLLRRHRFDKIPATSLEKKKISSELINKEVKGFRPSGLSSKFIPRLAKPTHQLQPEKREDLDMGWTIFGNDDRYLFDDNLFPWRTTGKVNTVGKWGSGVTIGPRHVLTASHVVNWTGGSGGGIAWLNFTPAYYDGRGPWGEFAVTRVIYWLQAPGQLSDQQTAFDYCILIMEERIGDIIGYPGYRTYDDDWNDGSYWQYIGYPGELSCGERPAFQGACVISSVGEEDFNGHSGYVLGHFNEFTPGQSGGVLWDWWTNELWPRVVGVGSTIGSTAVSSLPTLQMVIMNMVVDQLLVN